MLHSSSTIVPSSNPNNPITSKQTDDNPQTKHFSKLTCLYSSPVTEEPQSGWELVHILYYRLSFYNLTGVLSYAHDK